MTLLSYEFSIVHADTVPQSINYDSVDWDDRWDETEERDSEERWFDEEEEAEAPSMVVDT